MLKSKEIVALIIADIRTRNTAVLSAIQYHYERVKMLGHDLTNEPNRQTADAYFTAHEQILAGTYSGPRLPLHRGNPPKSHSMFHPSNYTRLSREKLADGSIYRRYSTGLQFMHHCINTFERPDGTVEITWDLSDWGRECLVVIDLEDPGIMSEWTKLYLG